MGSWHQLSGRRVLNGHSSGCLMTLVLIAPYRLWFFETKNLYKSGNLISIKFGGPNLGRSLKHQMLLWFVGWCFTCAGDWDSEAIIYRCLHASRKRNPSLLTVSSTFINRQPTSTDPNAQATSLQKCTIIWIDFLVPWKSNSNQHPEVFVTGQYQYYRSTSWLLIGVFATVTSFGTFCHYCMIRASHFWPLRQYFPPHHSAGNWNYKGQQGGAWLPSPQRNSWRGWKLLRWFVYFWGSFSDPKQRVKKHVI